MDQITLIDGAIAIAVIAPFVQWFGRQIPADLPFVSIAMAIALNMGLAWGLLMAGSVEVITLTTVWALAYNVGLPASIGTHIIGKTLEKNGFNTFGVFTPKDKPKNDHSS